MGRQLNYAEAVRMLGGGESRLIAFLDKIAGVGLVGGGLDLFDARQEAVRLGNSLTRDLSDRLTGLNRLSRTERLNAAHAVISLTAFFEAFGEVLPDLRPRRLDAGDQISLARVSASHGHRSEIGRRGIAQALLAMELPSPTPPRSYESLLEDLRGLYERLGRSTAEYVSGLELWEDLREAERVLVERRLIAEVPDLAVTRYEELFRQLATDCPEFGMWVELWHQRSARAELRGGLAALERLLEPLASGRVPGERRMALADSHRAALHKPITPGGEVPEGLRIPTLETGYIDHRLRVAVVDSVARPSQDSWWEGVPVLDDPSRFFAGYLTSQRALETPLIVLGQPGSGKSVLTRILAARLPMGDFLPVRVELRQAPTEMDLQTRIETAIRNATGEQIVWPRLVESCEGALPVVLLDGFDELLQATGVSETDFLMRVAGFQEREADQGRPVAVIVTSRTAVVDRARIPQGSVVVRLETFDDGQVADWLAAWNALNAVALQARGVRQLPTEVALAYRELAEQPLLLLMLALYDADVNALQNRPVDFDSTDLYERLLKEFARRELRKHATGLIGVELDRAVETELLRLSVVGFAMFNRRSQWVSESELDADLKALLGEPDHRPAAAGLRAPLSAAQLVVGRFFFVHETQVTRDDQALQTYEFLHATFGEFLVARLVVHVLTDMVTRETAALRSPLGAGVDDGLLYALLSFAGLTARTAVVGFLARMLDRLDAERRAALGELLLRLHAGALYARTGSPYDRYEPRRATVPTRHAVWSMNLVLLAVLVLGELDGERLFPAAEDGYAIAWRNEATLWRSRLSGEEWAGLYDNIALLRVWDGDRQGIRVRRVEDRHRVDGRYRPEPIDPFWLYNIPEGHPDRSGTFISYGHTPQAIQAKTNLTHGMSGDVMAHNLEPLGEAFPAMANAFVAIGPHRAVSATHALLAAFVARYRPDGAEAGGSGDVDGSGVGDDGGGGDGVGGDGGGGRCRDGRGDVYTQLAKVIYELSAAPPVEIGDDLYLRTALDVLLSAVEDGVAPPESLQIFRDGLPETTFFGVAAEGLFDRLNALLHTNRPGELHPE